MNIIELFENLNLKNTKSLELNSDEIIRLEKQINVEKRLNPEIDANVASNLVEAIKKYPEAFDFITNHRILYNLFAKKNYSINSFNYPVAAVDPNPIKLFISRFLEEDLVLFIDQNLAQNNFEELDILLAAKEYLPEDILYNLNKKAVGKIDYAMANLNNNPNTIDPFRYIKHRSFYDFLSNISSIEIDDKLKSLLNYVVDIYNKNRKSDFASTAILSMSNYKAFDEDFEGVLKRNRDVVYSNNSSTSSGNTGGGTSWRSIGIGIFILIRVLLAAGRCSSDHTTYTPPPSVDNYYENTNYYEPQVLDPYYKKMPKLIDSFKIFLTDYNSKDIKQLHPMNWVKTGENPFQTVYKDNVIPGPNDQIILFENKTKYDILLFENALAYDTIKIPKQSYFIKAGETLKMAHSQSYKRVFNFYVGKQLASFQTKSNHVFINYHSEIEPRFSQFIPDTKKIMKTDYNFDKDVVITEKKGSINFKYTNEPNEIAP